MSTPSYKIIGLVFDVLAALVSILDLATDLIILITWYSQERMVFFYISLSILISAQLSYVTIFYFYHGTLQWNSLCHAFISVLFTLPFSPILSFVFYFVSDRDSSLGEWIDKYLCCFDFDWNVNYVDRQASPLQQYLDDKLYKHLGFLMEAMVEAFPQSILQLTAIVYYNEPNLISVVSILISMSSFCSKIFLLVISGNFITWKMRLFVWLSFVVDFFGIFFIVSYSFYSPKADNLQIYFTNIGNVYFWEIILCIVPFAVIGSFGLHLYWTVKLTVDVVDSALGRCVFCPLVTFGITFLWIIGFFVTLLSMTIFCVWWAAAAVILMAVSDRLPWHKMSKKFYVDFIHWILNESHDIIDVDTKKILISKNKDRILRICVFNKFVLDEGWMNYFDKELLEFLQQKEKDRFKNVSYRDLRVNCDSTKYVYQGHTWQNKRKHPYFLQTFYYEVYASLLTEFKDKWNVLRSRYSIAVITLYLLIWIAGPIYIFSRIFNVFLPFLIVLYLHFYAGINLFTDLHTFQVLMWISYVILLCFWFIVAMFVIKDEFYLWHILPSTAYLKGPPPSQRVLSYNKVERIIKECYFEMTVYPLISKILNDAFGPHISQIVLHYFNNIQVDLFESHFTEVEAI